MAVATVLRSLLFILNVTALAGSGVAIAGLGTMRFGDRRRAAQAEFLPVHARDIVRAVEIVVAYTAIVATLRVEHVVPAFALLPLVMAGYFAGMIGLGFGQRPRGWRGRPRLVIGFVSFAAGLFALWWVIDQGISGVGVSESAGVLVTTTCFAAAGSIAAVILRGRGAFTQHGM